jgi:hypothetical protein
VLIVGVYHKTGKSGENPRRCRLKLAYRE